MKLSKRPTTITECINAAPKEAQKKLREMRGILKKAAPVAKEAVKWGETGAGPRRKAGSAWR